jgi:hypothetical protein
MNAPWRTPATLELSNSPERLLPPVTGHCYKESAILSRMETWLELRNPVCPSPEIMDL